MAVFLAEAGLAGAALGVTAGLAGAVAAGLASTLGVAWRDGVVRHPTTHVHQVYLGGRLDRLGLGGSGLGGGLLNVCVISGMVLLNNNTLGFTAFLGVTCGGMLCCCVMRVPGPHLDHFLRRRCLGSGLGGGLRAAGNLVAACHLDNLLGSLQLSQARVVGHHHHHQRLMSSCRPSCMGTKTVKTTHRHRHRSIDDGA